LGLLEAVWGGAVVGIGGDSLWVRWVATDADAKGSLTGEPEMTWAGEPGCRIPGEKMNSSKKFRCNPPDCDFSHGRGVRGHTETAFNCHDHVSTAKNMSVHNWR
jgi:hypothetical protein